MRDRGLLGKLMYAGMAFLVVGEFFIWGKGQHPINMVLLVFMILLIVITDRTGIKKIGKLRKEVEEAVRKLLSGRSYEAYMKEMLNVDENDTNAACADLIRNARHVRFSLEAVNEDWKRLINECESGYGNGAFIEDYIDENEFLDHCSYDLCSQVPSVLTAMGILGTFLGLVLGLGNFDFTDTADMTNSIQQLVGGLNVAFYTSVYGVTLSIIYNMYMRGCIGGLKQSLNRLYDVYNSAVKPMREDGKVFSGMLATAKAQYAAIQEMESLLQKGFGIELGNQISKNLKPVFEDINDSLGVVDLSLKSAMHGLRQEQEESMKRIVATFLEVMNKELNGNFDELGKTIGTLSVVQADMTQELTTLIAQMKSANTSSRQANKKTEEILTRMDGYMSAIADESRKNTELSEKMNEYTAHMDEFSMHQLQLSEQFTNHEGRITEVVESLNSNLSNMTAGVKDFSEAAAVVAEREKDPLQMSDIRQMLESMSLHNRHIIEQNELLIKQNEIQQSEMRVYQENMQEIGALLVTAMRSTHDGELPSFLRNKNEERKDDTPDWAEQLNATLQSSLQIQKQIMVRMKEIERRANRSLLERIKDLFTKTML